MTSQDEITRTADRLKDALGAGAEAMAVGDSPVLVLEPKARRAAAWLLPLTAAASVVLIVLTTVFVGHMYANAPTRGGSATGTTAAPPEFYATMAWASDKMVLDVRRTADGAVTASAPFSGTMPQTGFLTADASDRAFYAAVFPCTTATTVSRFFRITITDSGQISGITTVGSPIRGVVTDLAVSPDGSRIAYTQDSPGSCIDPKPLPLPEDAVNIMDLATGAVRTWQNDATAGVPARLAVLENIVGGLSWTPDGRTLIVNEPGAAGGLSGAQKLNVLGLDTASSGGSLQADSSLLWHQDPSCTTCMLEALAGPGDSLTAVEAESAGKQQTRQLIVRIPLAAGASQTVLYSALSPTPMSDSQAVIYADPSGQWVITWPLYDPYKPGWEADRAGWISGGTRHLLPGATPLYPNAIAW
jgi:hypothetical protein